MRYEPGLPNTWTPTLEEWDLMHVLDAEIQRVSRANGYRNRLENGVGSLSRDEAGICRFRGEWPVADNLKIPRRVDTSGPDGGIDLVAPNGTTLAIRFRTRRDWDLMTPVAHPFRTDVAVLVLAYGDRGSEIFGGMFVDDFYRAATVETFNETNGPSHYVAQRDSRMIRWNALRPRLVW